MESATFREILQAMSQENVEILRHAYQALNRGDIEAVLAICDSEIECRLPDGGISGTLRGHQALKGFLQSYLEAFESFQLAPEEFLDADDRVAVFLRMSGRGRGSGLEVDLRPAHVWTMQSGRAVRVEAFPDREREVALKAAGLSPKGR
jgi:ketosteroid isomerase-like protein